MNEYVNEIFEEYKYGEIDVREVAERINQLAATLTSTKNISDDEIKEKIGNIISSLFDNVVQFIEYEYSFPITDESLEPFDEETANTLLDGWIHELYPYHPDVYVRLFDSIDRLATNKTMWKRVINIIIDILKSRENVWDGLRKVI